MGTPIFWVVQIPEKYEWSFEVFQGAKWGCPKNGKRHHAKVVMSPGWKHPEDGNDYYPRYCDCGFAFTDHADERLDRFGHGSPVYRRLDNGDEIKSPLPPGACYLLDDDMYWKGPDGKMAVCVLPNGHHWYIDSRASNCTMMNDNVHRCWVRHGTLGDRLHVDKNGNTCAAGAGSIHSGSYHGFLHNGELTP